MEPERRPVVGGNWKCNGSLEKINSLLKAWSAKKVGDHADVVIGVPDVYIPFALQLMRNDFYVAAENCYPKSGAFTGETSVDFLEDLGLKYCIIGHSERRHIFKETNEGIKEKVIALQNKGINVIGCIGETLEERKKGSTFDVLFEQMEAYAEALKGKGWDKFIIAYEPVWAIGTGVVATPEQAQQVHEKLRKWVEEKVSKEVADKIRIIYGGSVKPANCNDLFKKKDVDGFLVGGASLQPDFDIIINSTKEK